MELPRFDNGDLQAFAWPGGYPIYYLDKEDSVLCPACANASDKDQDELPQFKPVAYGINWECEYTHCSQCDIKIESAYGDSTDDDVDKIIDSLDDFTRSYLETAIWSSTVIDPDNDSCDTPMDRDYSIEDLSIEALRSAIGDCKAFQEQYGEAIDNADRVSRSGQYNNREMAGHDFWLTRNGHGAGFWDGDWPDDLGSILTAASKVYGGVDMYVGDDGRIYS